jgi:CHASE2 domain-containing sensor protein/serine phosphatase RsbU (regulator of sigma subunit)
VLASARRGRLAGLVLLVILALLIVGPELLPARALRLMSFDAYHALAPRVRRSAPAVIVEVDDVSLARFGQWPWPRRRLAQLVAMVGQGRPAAIGIDLIMPEPDRLSPDRLPELLFGLSPDLARLLGGLPDSDRLLGETLARLPSVLGVVGLDRREAGSVVAIERQPVRLAGPNPRPFLRHFAAAFRSVDPIARGAAGQGLINASFDGRVVRRVALASVVGEGIVPALGVEMLRVASATPALTIYTGRGGVEAIRVGDVTIPTEPDGSAWIHFAPLDAGRFVSAADVLTGRLDPSLFERKLVLIGVTAVGLGDRHATPVAPSMTGVEVHAQLLENIFDGGLLARPWWIPWLEAALLVLGGGLVILAVPVWSVGRAALLVLAALAVILVAGFAVYLRYGALLGIMGPALGVVVTYGAMLGFTLTEVQRQRRALRRQLDAEREASARVAGELEAARRIQMGTLPAPADVLAGDDRVAIYAVVEPARVVGGDLYDFFRLDEHRLFFLVGDVSGHGLPGSLFMAVAKALCKSAALRSGGDVGAMMRESSAEISRDNPGALFVTLWVGLLDERTGQLQYCNGGHEPAWLLAPEGTATQPLGEGGGPPLCVMDGFPYAAGSYRMRPGETICLVTDGVAEAMDGAGALYGRARLAAVLGAIAASASVREVGEAIARDVGRFASGADVSDDLTVLVVRWNGTGAAGAGAR